MIKTYVFINKKNEISDESFSKHWLNINGPLANRIKTLGGYIQSHRVFHTVPEFPTSSEPSGIQEFWTDNLDDAKGIFEDPEYLNGMYKDQSSFVILGETQHIFTREHVIIELPKLEIGTSNYIKSIYLVKRKPGMNVTEFQKHWLEVHAPLIPGWPGVLGYSVSHVVDECYEQKQQPVFDGVAELWWPDIDTFIAAWNSKKHRDEQVNDLITFVDMENTPGMLTKPIRLI